MRTSYLRMFLLRLFRFNAVGCGNLLLKLGLLAALKEWLALSYLAATALAVEIAILHGFFWHHVWTWGDRRVEIHWREVLRRALRYNLVVGFLAFTINLGLMRALVDGFGLHYLLAGAIATASAGLLNFLISDTFIFVLARKPDSPLA